jgi:hypothetical protein
MWETEGVHGSWRKLLHEGYAPGETYFEFGVMPEKRKEFGDYRVVLDHDVFVRLCPKDNPLRGQYVIRPDDIKAGRVDTEDGRYKTFYVLEAEYSQMLKEAQQIYDEYKNEIIVCFWSIPNKWLSDCFLIKFIAENIVETDGYRNRIRGRDSFFWP